MTYRETLDWLYARLPMFSRIGAAAIKPDLTNTIALCAALGDPQQKFPSIHIAGTNGKGSTSHMLAATFMEAGYKTGLYTSPHLLDFRERIRIDGRPVPHDFVIHFVARHKDLIERIQPSFFEITVAMAFTAFADSGTDIAIIETGLGGRLDSTNVIIPELSIITNISLDHTDLLGKDIPSIAREKAGIIKERTPVVVGEFDEESLPVFEETALARNAPLFKAWENGQVITTGDKRKPGELIFRRSGDKKEFVLKTDLRGHYQEKNIRTVLTALSVMEGNGWNVSIETAARALPLVTKQTGLRGRFDLLQERPAIIADVGHNPAGLAQVLQDWNLRPEVHKHILMGFVRDKDVRASLSIFPKNNTFHFCAADMPRALPVAELGTLAEAAGLHGIEHSSVSAAIDYLKKMLQPGDALLITGSFFIVGEAMSALGMSAE